MDDHRLPRGGSDVASDGFVGAFSLMSRSVARFSHVPVFFAFGAAFFAGALALVAVLAFGAAFLVSVAALAAAFFGFALADGALPPFSMMKAIACSIVTDCGSSPFGS